MENYEEIFDLDYMDIESLIVDAMDFEICECSSTGQSAVLITLRSEVQVFSFALKDAHSNFSGSQKVKTFV